MKLSLQDLWYRQSPHILSLLLLPLSGLFFIFSAIRRGLYKSGVFKTYYFNPPVIVIGNITVGGTGKTPFVIALTQFLQAQGYKPGIVSRGVGGKRQRAHWVEIDDSPEVVGDEALLLKRNTQCPVVIGVNRALAVEALLSRSDCNVVISDDGLQHYRLDRDIEIVMLDNIRRFGNGYLLPAGPLREKKSRLKSAHFLVVNGGDENDTYTMSLQPLELVSVVNPARTLTLSAFPFKQVHAVAGIGHPQKFFQILKNARFDILTHVFPDHHLYQAQELNFNDDLTIIMTEKDAVKCGAFADERYWFLRVNTEINTALKQAILTKIRAVEKCNECEIDYSM